MSLPSAVWTRPTGSPSTTRSATALLEVLRRLSPRRAGGLRAARRVRDAVRHDRGDRRPTRRHLSSAGAPRAGQVRCGQPDSPRSPPPSISSSPRGSSPRAPTVTSQALTAVLDPTVWGVGTILADRRRRLRSTMAQHEVGRQPAALPRPGATLVSGPVGQPVLLAFSDRRLFAVIVLTIRDNLVLKIEATIDPWAAARSQ